MSSKRSFEWDIHNLSHFLIDNGLREITPQEVESIFFDPNHIITLQDVPKANEQRYRIIGISAKSRILTIIFTVRSGLIRPVTGWQTSSKSLSFKQYHERLK